MSASEIALLKQQIEETCQAMQLGLTGYALTSQHRIIEHKYHQFEVCTQQLEALIGPEEATQIACEIYNRTIERKHV